MIASQLAMLWFGAHQVIMVGEQWLMVMVFLSLVQATFGLTTIHSLIVLMALLMLLWALRLLPSLTTTSPTTMRLFIIFYMY